MDVSPARLGEICAAFPRQRLVVIGDVMLDHLVIGEARRISPEAPIPVVNVLSESHTPGGAANVARNVAALGATVDLFGIVGDDAPAATLQGTLAPAGIGLAGLVAEPGRPTTVKSRVTAQRHQIVRLDRETTRPPSPATTDALMAGYRRALPGAAAVIVADYAKGAIDQRLLSDLLDRARLLGIPVFIDPKPSRRLAMRGCTALTPNRKEAFELAALADAGGSSAPAQDPHLLAAAAAIAEQHAPDVLLITLGEAGLLLVERGAAPRHIPTFARQVSDVTGAGDTVIATFALASAAGAAPWEAAVLANHAAGVVVSKPGTATVSTQELLAWLDAPSA